MLHGVPRFVSLLGKSHCLAEIQPHFPRTSVMSRIDHNSLFTFFKGDIGFIFKRCGRNCVKFTARNRLWRPQLSGVASPFHLRNSSRHYSIIFCTLMDRPHAIMRLVLWSYTAGSIPVVTDRRLILAGGWGRRIFWNICIYPPDYTVSYLSDGGIQ